MPDDTRSDAANRSRPDDAEVRKDARAAYRRSLDRRQPLTGAQLAERYGRKPRWGNYRIREVLDEAPAWVSGNGAPVGEIGDDETCRSADPAGVANGHAGRPVRMAASGDGAPAAQAEPQQAPVSPWLARSTRLAVLAVALAAAFASVEHLADVARMTGQTGARAWLLPASVDGLVLASSTCFYRAHRCNEPVGLLPKLSLLLGFTASVAGNVVSVSPELVPTLWLRVIVAAWYPVALSLAFDTALRQGSASAGKTLLPRRDDPAASPTARAQQSPGHGRVLPTGAQHAE